MAIGNYGYDRVRLRKSWGDLLPVLGVCYLIFTHPISGTTADAPEISQSPDAKAAATPYDFPPLPWTFTYDFVHTFFGFKQIGAPNPPDNVQDPNITYTTESPLGLVSYIAIGRFTSSPFGAWDQIFIQSSPVKMGPGPSYNRATQLYSSVIPPTLPDNPTHLPHKLGRFVWTTSSRGTTDVRVFAPPNATLPVLTVRGLRAIPALSLPFQIGGDHLQSVVSSYDPQSAVLGHVIDTFDFSGTFSPVIWQGYETLTDELSLDGGLLSIGFSLRNGTLLATGKPFM